MVSVSLLARQMSLLVAQLEEPNPPPGFIASESVGFDSLNFHSPTLLRLSPLSFP